eukprot:Gb_15499 [translate_table: standard]
MGVWLLKEISPTASYSLGIIAMPEIYDVEPTPNAIVITTKPIEQGVNIVSCNPGCNLCSLLQCCIDTTTLAEGKQDGHHVFDKMYEQNVISWTFMIASVLVDIYAKCGSIEDAWQVFDKTPKPNVILWPMMIVGYAQNVHGENAIELLGSMQQAIMKLNQFTFASVLNACASLASLQWGKQIHALIIKVGLEFDVSMGSSLVDMIWPEWMWPGSSETLLPGVRGKHQAQPVHLCKCSQGLCDLERFGSRKATLEVGKQVHAYVIKVGLESGVCVGSALVDMYVKCGRIEDAQNMFDIMPEHDMVSWTAVILGYASALVDIYVKCGIIEDARKVFDKMSKQAMVSWNSMIVGYAQHGHSMEAVQHFDHVGLLNEGHHFFDSLSQDYGITPTREHYSCMVDLLGCVGCLDEARDFINKMPFEPNALVWGTLLGACRIHYNVKLGECVVEYLLKLEPQAGATYVLLSNMYATIGRWDDVAKSNQQEADICVWKDKLDNLKPLHMEVYFTSSKITSDANVVEISEKGTEEWGELVSSVNDVISSSASSSLNNTGII